MVYILAEMAASHDGSIDHAKEIIEGAIEAGADGILFQVFDLDSAVEKTHEDYEDLKSFHLPFSHWRDLLYMYWTKIDIWINVGDEKTLNWCRLHEDKIRGLKNHASKTHLSTWKFAWDFKKPFLFHIPNWAQYDDINVPSTYAVDSQGIVMYGIQNFPTDPRDLNFAHSKGWHDWGYADHSKDWRDTITLCALAMGLHAKYLELHVTWSKWKGVQDTVSAMDVTQFNIAVGKIRVLEEILSHEPREITKGEKQYQQYIEHVRTRK